MSFRQLRKLREAGGGGRRADRHLQVDSSLLPVVEKDHQHESEEEAEDSSQSSEEGDGGSTREESRGVDQKERGRRTRRKAGVVGKKSTFLLYDSDEDRTGSSSSSSSSGEETDNRHMAVSPGGGSRSAVGHSAREPETTPKGEANEEHEDSEEEKRNRSDSESTPNAAGVDKTQRTASSADTQKKRKKKKKKKATLSRLSPPGISCPSSLPEVGQAEAKDYGDAPTEGTGLDDETRDGDRKGSGRSGRPEEEEEEEEEEEGEKKISEGERLPAQQADPGHRRGPPGSKGGTPYCLLMERGMFNTDNELRRIFGREITRSLGGPESGTPGGGGGRGGGPGRRARRPAGGDSSARRRCWLLPDGDSMLLPSSLSYDYVRMIREEDHGERDASLVEDRNSRKQPLQAGRRKEDTASESVEFALQYTPFYEQLQESFHAIVHAHDPQNLHHFLQRHPGHIDSLLYLSDAYRTQGQHETATQFSKRALSVLQKAFHPSFSPFLYTAEGLPQVAVDSGNPFNKNLFKCIGLYGAALADQGCYRTALEVSKLLVAMDLPRDAFHAMLHLDYYALRARQWQFLLHFASCFVQQHLTYVIPLTSLTAEGGEPGGSTGLFRNYRLGEATEEEMKISDLSLILPNFAFSSALALFLHGSEGTNPEDVKAITIEDMLSICPAREPLPDSTQAQLPHLLLMRAVLLFPSFVRRLLQKLAVNGSQKVADSVYSSLSWEQLLFSPPLWDRTGYAHERYSEILGLLVSCYVQKAHDMWRADIVLRWLHSCVSHLHHMYQSSYALKKFRRQWSKAVFLFDVSRYKDVRVSEFDRIPTLPAFLLDENTETPPNATPDIRSRIHYVSVNSSPILIFLETFLPWSRVDFTGLKAEPKHVSDILRSCCSLLRRVASALCSGTRYLVAGTSRLIRSRSCPDATPLAGPGVPTVDEAGTQADSETGGGVSA